MKLVKNENENLNNKVSDKEAEEAFIKILKWMGENPSREGLIETPKRVMKAFKEYFKGYNEDGKKVLEKTFGDIEGYDDMVVQKNISVQSHCEHHMVPIIGEVTVGYLPSTRVVGISKLARVVEAFAKRLQIQERLTTQIADAIESALNPQGVAVLIEAQHQCMTTRGIKKPGVAMLTKCMRGVFQDDPEARSEFMSLVRR